MAEVTRKDIREIVSGYFKAKQTSWNNQKTWNLLINYPNVDLVDVNTQAEPFLAYDLIFQHGDPIGIGYCSEHRMHGSILMEGYTRTGSGMSKIEDVMDYFYRDLHQTDTHEPLITYTAAYGKNSEWKDWTVVPLVIPFHFVSS